MHSKSKVYLFLLSEEQKEMLPVWFSFHRPQWQTFTRLLCLVPLYFLSVSSLWVHYVSHLCLIFLSCPGLPSSFTSCASVLNLFAFCAFYFLFAFLKEVSLIIRDASAESGRHLLSISVTIRYIILCPIFTAVAFPPPHRVEIMFEIICCKSSH